MSRRNSATLPHLTSDVERLVEDFAKETDRGVALLAAAFLDDVLDVMLRTFFVDDPEAVNKLVGSGRPLESFGSRTHLAFCVGLLGRDIYHDINLVREIRNDFAHRHPKNFTTAEIMLKCQKLQVVRTLMADESCAFRDRFIATVVLIANHLMVQTEAIQHAAPAKDFAENGVLRLR
jgi:DNA-binding MltR family transcriptional regulator